MRVLIATGLYPPDIGGPATYSKLLNDELPKHGIEVEIVSFGDVRKWPKGVRHILYYLKILKLGKKTDILYAQDPVSVGLPTMKAAQKLGKPFVLKIVGDYAWEQGTQRFGVTDMLDDFASKRDGYHPQVIRFKNIQESVANAAEKIIVPSKYLKDVVIKWGISRDKIQVIYNGFNAPTNISPAQLSGNPVIVSVGRLVPWKGFTKLINLIPELQEDFPGSELYIVGDGPDKKLLEDRINEKKLESKVHIVGKVSHDKLLGYLAGADVFVLNTGYEGLPHVVLEAMAMGTPVVTTDVGGNKEVLRDNYNGLLVPYNNQHSLKVAISRVLSDKTLSQGFVYKAKGTLKEFSKEQMLDETVTLLQNI